MPRRYMPQMDGLRAYSVFAVLVHHAFNLRIPIGTWGVLVFFVISGYLITGSLLRIRDLGMPLRDAAWTFFIRRARRLVPAFVTMMAIALVCIPAVRPDWLWYASYTSNVLASLRPGYIELGPTWSLSVEEQFYLVWFFVALCVPWRRLPVIIFACITTALAFRLTVFLTGNFASYQLLPGDMDSLALGASLCVLERRDADLPKRTNYLALGIIAAVSIGMAVGSPWSPVFWAAWPTLIAMVAAWLVWRSRTGFGGFGGWLLGNPVVVYLGRISYGIYLYQMVVTELPGLWRLHGPGVPLFMARCAVIVLMASASFYGLERPIMRASRRNVWWLEKRSTGLSSNAPCAEVSAGPAFERTSPQGDSAPYVITD